MKKRISWYDAEGNIKVCQTVEEGLEDVSCPEDGLQWVEGHPDNINGAKFIDGQIVNGDDDWSLPTLEEIRYRRNMRLKNCDWTQAIDSPLSVEKKAEWSNYRQQLRDLPANYTDDDDFADVVFPTPPT
jgi:hypothetical protein